MGLGYYFFTSQMFDTMKKKIYLALFLSWTISSASALDLVEAYQLAVQNDAAWQANQLRFRVEQQNLGIAQGAILPTVGVNASIHQQRQHIDTAQAGLNIDGQNISFYDDKNTQRQAAVNLRQPIFRMDVWEQYQKAKISVQLAELKLQSQKQELILNVVQAYFNTLRQQHLLQVYQQEEKVLLHQYRMMQAKFQQGFVAKMDVTEADAQYQSVIAKRVASEVQVALAEERLAELIGRSDTALANLSADFNFQAPVPNNVNDWTQLAQTHNLDLKQFIALQALAEQQIKVEQADAYPQLAAVAGTTWSKQNPENIMSNRGRTDNIGLELNWSPYVGTRQQLVKKARLERDAAKVDVDAQRKTIHTAVKQAYLQVMSGASQLSAYRTAMQSAQLVADASQASYQEGLKSMVDVLLAQRNAFAAKQDYVNAQYDYVLNVFQLRALSGQLDEQDVMQFNAWLE